MRAEAFWDHISEHLHCRADFYPRKWTGGWKVLEECPISYNRASISTLRSHHSIILSNHGCSRFNHGCSKLNRLIKANVNHRWIFTGLQHKGSLLYVRHVSSPKWNEMPTTPVRLAWIQHNGSLHVRHVLSLKWNEMPTTPVRLAWIQHSGSLYAWHVLSSQLNGTSNTPFLRTWD